jgi:hypothetical protein
VYRVHSTAGDSRRRGLFVCDRLCLLSSLPLVRFGKPKASPGVAESFIESVRIRAFLIARDFDHRATALKKKRLGRGDEGATDSFPADRFIHDHRRESADRTWPVHHGRDMQRHRANERCARCRSSVRCDEHMLTLIEKCGQSRLWLDGCLRMTKEREQPHHFGRVS